MDADPILMDIKSGEFYCGQGDDCMLDMNWLLEAIIHNSWTMVLR